MLLKLILLIPSVLSIALCTYLLAGVFIYFRSLYKTLPAVSNPARQSPAPLAFASTAAPVEIEAIPAT
jgi:hypothetical protein